MPRILVALLLWTVLAPSAWAQSADDPYTIMKPEPWLPPKYQSPRGTKQHVDTYAPAPAPPRAPAVPPPVYVPETGRLLPNLPALPGAGQDRAEHPQDRAVRCAHQAGLYGEAAGNRAAYVGACVNQ